MEDEADILHEYTDQAGIVVPFPQTTAQHAKAVVEYAKQLETELVKAEAEIAKLLAYIKHKYELESKLEVVGRDNTLS